MHLTESSHYSIHRFEEKDMPAYKALRLEALAQEPGMFGNSHALEEGFSNEQWTARVTNPDGACFGLYKDGALIGITGVTSDPEQPGEAYMTQSYIRREYRGLGLSRMLYEARFAWARSRGIRRLVIGHRECNSVSRAANQRFGFRYTHRQSRLWPDGVTEDMLYYVLEL